jgi:hypothetical protein
MSYYRIQIDELQNGEKRYIPQKAELRVYGGWIKKQEIRWYNIGDGRLDGRYFSETEAMRIIENNKEYEELKKGLEIKSSTYKIID